MSLALGVDIGTSGVRTAVVDEGGQVLSMAKAAHPAQDPAQIDADLWWSAVQTCLTRQVTELQKLGHDPSDITGIAVDGTSGSMVLTDAEVKPVSRALMYNSKGFDAEADLIAQHAPETHITQGSNSALARAMRLVSEAKAEPVHLLHQADFIAAKLVGRGGHSDFNNALKTGFDPETETWPDWVANVIDSALLPKVVAPGTALSAIDPTLAATLGLSANVKIHAGTTDSIAAFLAAAPMEPGVAVTSLGSTLAVKALSRNRIDNPSTGLYSHRLGDFWLVGGASNTGGAVLAGIFTPDEMATLSAQMDPKTPTGLDYYPLSQPGERFPINDPELPPKLDPRPEDDVIFLQGMYEGIARIEAQCYAEIKAQGGDYPTAIYGAGGGASDPTFCEIRSAALGVVPKVAKALDAAVGVAKLAGRSEN